MATLISNADGNLTGAATFAAAETGALALVTNRNTAFSIAAASSYTSTTFTITNAKVIDGMVVWIKQAAAGSTGTLKVDLQKGGVSQASVTVNKTDLPDATSLVPPVFFKFTSTATGDGGSNWTVVMTTTGTQNVTYYAASAVNTNLTRALRTTTAATPAAGDDLYILGELTGAGTKTTRTVTMDSTAATAYGNGALNSTTVAGGTISISHWATLAYANAASTNYILRVAGDVIVYGNGRLDVGASGAEIPRTSTAVLEFQPVSADGDFGLRILDNAVCNMAGLSRTSGKNVVACKLTADAVGVSTLSTGPTNSNTSTATVLEATGNSLLATAVTDNATASATHYTYYTVSSVVTNVTQVLTVWLARGSGTNNRYVRLILSDSISATPTNGCYTDIDLQAGTAGTATAIGNGTGTSVSITPAGTGYVVRLTGKVSSGAATPRLVMVTCSALGTITYTGNTTQCFIFDKAAIVTTASISDTTFSVDTDTGWLNGDAICVASTSRTGTEAEIFPLSADAGSSSMITASYLGVGAGVGTLTHLGTAPRQAEVMNLTRNVKVRSTSATLMGYVYCAALATVNFSWVEFRYLGMSGTVTKRGIEIDISLVATPTTNPKSITYCSMHDGENAGLYCYNSNLTTGPSVNLTFSNNVGWLCAGTFGVMSTPVTNNDWTFNSNIIVRCGGGWSLGDIGGTFTNNIVSSGTASVNSFQWGETNATFGNFSGNTTHSCSYQGLQLTTDAMTGTISNFTAWRNGQVGVLSGANLYNVVFDGLTLFGNLSPQMTVATAGSTPDLTVRNAVITSDAAFSSALGLNVQGTLPITLRLDNVDMSATATGGGGAAHTTADINLQTANHTKVEVIARNCKFGTNPVYNSKTPWSQNSFMSFEKFNQTAGDHRTELKYGTLKTDSAVYNSTSPSMRMTPNDATNKLQSAPLHKGILAAVANAGTVTPAVYVRKSASGDGAAYNGNQPRLIVRANPAVGINADTVLDTMSVATGSWEILTGTTAAATDDGAMEFIVDCDGTTGWVNVDDWSMADVPPITTSAEVTAFLARTSGLDTTHTNAYTALIDGLVADGVWSKLDMLHVYATQDAMTALLNLVSSSYNGTAHGSPTFTADRGYTGVDNSGTVYIGTGFNPSSASSPKFVQDSAHISAWSVTNAAGSVNGPIGVVSASTSATIFPKYNDNTTFYSRVNSTGLNVATPSTSQGHFLANRSSSSSTQAYRNGSSAATNGANTSVSVPIYEVLTLSINVSQVPTGSPHQVAMASIGSSLSSTDVTNFYNRLRTYMTAVGVP